MGEREVPLPRRASFGRARREERVRVRSGKAAKKAGGERTPSAIRSMASLAPSGSDAYEYASCRAPDERAAGARLGDASTG